MRDAPRECAQLLHEDVAAEVADVVLEVVLIHDVREVEELRSYRTFIRSCTVQ